MTESELFAILRTVDSEEGRRRLAAYLETTPFPHYEPIPGRPGIFVRIEADGSRTEGRFVGREWTLEDHQSIEG